MQLRISTVTGRLRVRWWSVVSVAVALVALSPAGALAAQTTIGPPSASPTSHSEYDRDANTVTLDETGAASEAQEPGILTDVRYFAGPDSQAGGGDLVFVAVNPSSRSFDWVGSQIADSSTATGGLTYNPGAQNTYTPAQTVAIPQGDALGVYQSSDGIIPFDSTGSNEIVQENLATGSGPPAAGDQFSNHPYGPNARDYAFQGDFDPATQLVVNPAPGNPGTAPAGSLDQLQYLASFQDAGGMVVPDNADAQNIAISSTGGTVTDCHGNPTTHPSISATAGVYSFCVQVSDTVGTDAVSVSDPGASSVASGGATVTQSAPQPSQVTVTITPAPLQAGGSAQIAVTAHLTDASGDAFPGRTVTFTASPAGGPTISPATSTTNSANDAVTTLTASRTAGAYTITATDTATGVTGSAEVTQTAPPAPTPSPTGTGGAPTTTPSPLGSAPTPTSTQPRTPTAISYTYFTAHHRAITASAKLTGCKTTYAGKGKKRHRTGNSCRLALTIKSLKVARGSRARLTRSGTLVGTGTTHGSTVTLTVVPSRIKSGSYTLAISERDTIQKVTLQVHVT